MSICQESADLSAWLRWTDKALELSREREPATSAISGPPVRLALLAGDGDDITAPVNPGHPALRAIERKKDGAS